MKSFSVGVLLAVVLMHGFTVVALCAGAYSEVIPSKILLSAVTQEVEMCEEVHSDDCDLYVCYDESPGEVSAEAEV